MADDNCESLSTDIVAATERYVLALLKVALYQTKQSGEETPEPPTEYEREPLREFATREESLKDGITEALRSVGNAGRQERAGQ